MNYLTQRPTTQITSIDNILANMLEEYGTLPLMQAKMFFLSFRFYVLLFSTASTNYYIYSILLNIVVTLNTR